MDYRSALQSQNPMDRIAALLEIKHNPQVGLTQLDVIFQTVANPLNGVINLESMRNLNEGKEPSKGKARRIFRSHMREAVAAIVSSNNEAIRKVAPRITALPDGERSEMASAISNKILIEWILESLTQNRDEEKQQAAEFLQALAIEFYGRIALTAPGGTLAGIVSSKPQPPEVFKCLNETHLKTIAEVVKNDNDQKVRICLARAIGAWFPSNAIQTLIKELLKDKIEAVANAAKKSQEIQKVLEEE